MTQDIESESVPNLIGIIVAIVVFATVLVPITNAIGDNSGSGTNPGELTLVNTEQDIYEDVGIVCNYKSLQFYSNSPNSNESLYGSEIPDDLTITLDMDFINGYLNNIEKPVGTENTVTTNLFELFVMDYSTEEHISIKIGLYEDVSSIQFLGDAFNHGGSTWTLEYALLENVSEFNLTATAERITLDYTVEWTHVPGGPHSYSYDMEITDDVEYDLFYLSNEDVGWIVSCVGDADSSNPEDWHFAEVMAGSTFGFGLCTYFDMDGVEVEGWANILAQLGEISSGNVSRGTTTVYGIIYGDDDGGYTCTYTFEYEIHLTPTSNGRYMLDIGSEPSDTWTLVNVSNIRDADNTSVTAQITNMGTYWDGGYYDNQNNYISTVNANPLTYGSEGGQGGNGGNGMVNTIIGLIPVFVAIGLILAIVGMFYTNRSEINE